MAVSHGFDTRASLSQRLQHDLFCHSATRPICLLSELRDLYEMPYEDTGEIAAAICKELAV